MSQRLPSCRIRRPGTGGGFSLIELITVIAITGILAAVAVPSLASLSTSRAAAVARSAQRDLTFARQRAIATGTPTWVVFDVGAETWSVLAENPSSPGRAGATILTDAATGHAFTQTLGDAWSAGIGLTSASFDGAAEVGFDWLGRPLNNAENALAADGTLTITGNQQVRVYAGTGYASYIAP